MIEQYCCNWRNQSCLEAVRGDSMPSIGTLVLRGGGGDSIAPESGRVRLHLGSERSIMVRAWLMASDSFLIAYNEARKRFQSSRGANIMSCYATGALLYRWQ